MLKNLKTRVLDWLKGLDVCTLACAVLALGLIVAGATLAGYPGMGLVAAGGLIWLDLREPSGEQGNG